MDDTAKAGSWRDSLKVHPAADLFPMMSEAELDELAADIAKNGLQQPIVWLGNALLDGRNRLAAIYRIPDKQRREAIGREIEGKKSIVHFGGDEPLGAGIDPWAYVVSANIRRRHLTTEQKREVIAALLKAKPERSDHATAKVAKVSDKTVTAVRRELERRSEIPNVTTRADTKGRQQPARKLKPLAAPKPTSGNARDKAISGFSTVLHQQLIKTLDDLVRILGDERGRVAEIPLSKRVAIARGYLQALGVSPDDLRPIDEISTRLLGSGDAAQAALQPKASNRQIAATLGVHHRTIDRDLGANAPAATIKAKDSPSGNGANAPRSLSGQDAARAVQRLSETRSETPNSEFGSR